MAHADNCMFLLCIYLVVETSAINLAQISDSVFIVMCVRSSLLIHNLIYVTFSDIIRSFQHSFRNGAWYRNRSFVCAFVSRRACRRIQAKPFSPLTMINCLKDN